MNLVFLIVICLYNYLIFKSASYTIESTLLLFGIVIIHFLLITFVFFLYLKFFLNEPLAELPELIICLYMSISPLFFLLSHVFQQKIFKNTTNFHKKEVFNFKTKKELLVFYFCIVSVIQLLVFFN